MRKYMTWMLAFLTLFAGVTVTACGGSGDGSGSNIIAPSSNVSGTWTGSYSYAIGSSYYTTPVSASLNDLNGNISGSGFFGSGSTATAETFTGTYTPPNITIVIHDPGTQDAVFTGTVRGNIMTGVLNGSGFNNDAITFTRNQ